MHEASLRRTLVRSSGNEQCATVFIFFVLFVCWCSLLRIVQSYSKVQVCDARDDYQRTSFARFI